MLPSWRNTSGGQPFTDDDGDGNSDGDGDGDDESSMQMPAES